MGWKVSNPRQNKSSTERNKLQNAVYGKCPASVARLFHSKRSCLFVQFSKLWNYHFWVCQYRSLQTHIHTNSHNKHTINLEVSDCSHTERIWSLCAVLQQRLAEFETGARLDGVKEFFTQHFLVAELRQFEQIHAGAGTGKTLFISPAMMNAECWVKLLRETKSAIIYQVFNNSLKWFFCTEWSPEFLTQDGSKIALWQVAVPATQSSWRRKCCRWCTI